MSEQTAPVSPASTPGAPSPEFPAAGSPGAGRKRLAFFVVAAVLLFAGVGLNTAIARLGINLRKAPVDLRQPLVAIKSELGPWVQVSLDRALNADTEHELGTKLYVFRNYFDTRLLKPDEREKLLAMSIAEREAYFNQNAAAMLGGRVYFAITYYTGGPDTVPHVPDRCYVADGFQPSTYDVVNWPILPRQKPADRETKVRLINFIDQIDSRRAKPVQVAYFFQVNGAYEHDPIFGVRKRRANLLESRGYHAKIEVRTDVDSAQEAEPIMCDFLQHAMPEVERVLPDGASFGEATSAPTTAPSTQPAE